MRSLTRFEIRPLDGRHGPFFTTARDAASAWRKFTTQRCGPCKPDRKDYQIKEQPCRD
jgi:hypothetical protein